MIPRIKSILGLFSSAPKVSVHQDQDRAPPIATRENLIQALRDGGRCFHCGSADHWVPGPRGGAMQNFMCGCCGQGANICAEVVEMSDLIETPNGREIRNHFRAEGGTIRNRWDKIQSEVHSS